MFLYFVNYCIPYCEKTPYLFRKKVVPYTDKNGVYLSDELVFEKGKKLCDKLKGSLIKNVIDNNGYVISSVVYIAKKNKEV